MRHILCFWILLSGISSLVFCGCGKEKPAGQATEVARVKPKEAAAQLQEAFTAAPTEAKENATIASEALRQADYEKAVVALQVIKDQGSLTFEQGLAVHNSMVSLEARLIAAMGAGDQNAKQAYEILKKSKRN